MTRAEAIKENIDILLAVKVRLGDLQDELNQTLRRFRRLDEDDAQLAKTLRNLWMQARGTRLDVSERLKELEFMLSHPREERSDDLYPM